MEQRPRGTETTWSRQQEATTAAAVAMVDASSIVGEGRRLRRRHFVHEICVRQSGQHQQERGHPHHRSSSSAWGAWNWDPSVHINRQGGHVHIDGQGSPPDGPSQSVHSRQQQGGDDVRAHRNRLDVVILSRGPSGKARGEGKKGDIFRKPLKPSACLTNCRRVQLTVTSKDGKGSLTLAEARSTPHLPLSSDNIITVEHCQRWKHQRGLPIHSPASVDGASLLIEFDYLEAMVPLEITAGTPGEPLELRTCLG